ncbi:MAG: type II 3-dehydroquinate dehydratase [Polyangiaceae bacterium]
MQRVLVLSGPNLDRLGARAGVYGTTTLAEIHARLASVGLELGVAVVARQSAHEGELVTWVNSAKDEGFEGLVINPGGYAHTSVALHDALLDSPLVKVEVHVTNTDAREPFRRRALTARACTAKVAGFGALSYELGLRGVVALLDRAS